MTPLHTFTGTLGDYQAQQRAQEAARGGTPGHLVELQETGGPREQLLARQAAGFVRLGLTEAQAVTAALGRGGPAARVVEAAVAPRDPTAQQQYEILAVDGHLLSHVWAKDAATAEAYGRATFHAHFSRVRLVTSAHPATKPQGFGPEALAMKEAAFARLGLTPDRAATAAAGRR